MNRHVRSCGAWRRMYAANAYIRCNFCLERNTVGPADWEVVMNEKGFSRQEFHETSYHGGEALILGCLCLAIGFNLPNGYWLSPFTIFILAGLTLMVLGLGRALAAQQAEERAPAEPLPLQLLGQGRWDRRAERDRRTRLLRRVDHRVAQWSSQNPNRRNGRDRRADDRRDL